MVKYRENELTTHVMNPERKLLIPNRVSAPPQHSSLGLELPQLNLHIGVLHTQVPTLQHVRIKPHSCKYLQTN